MKNGIIVINKVSGVSSGYVVNKLKHLTGLPCGHMGTLDPLACGVLPVGVGKATRLFDYYLQKKKQYIAEFRFGVTADTLDSTGEVICENPYIPTREELEHATHAQVGTIAQMPPKYSAKSVNGVRGYKLARAGVEFELQPKEVTITRFDLIDQLSNDSYRFIIDCSAGTYIRSMARDLANACGADGIMTALQRTKSGEFLLENSVTLEELTPENVDGFIIPTEALLLDMPTISIPNPHIFNGLPQWTREPDGLYKIYQDGEFYGIVEVVGGKAKIKTKLC